MRARVAASTSSPRAASTVRSAAALPSRSPSALPFASPSRRPSSRDSRLALSHCASAFKRYASSGETRARSIVRKTRCNSGSG
ncbi:MAG TPA: hypothetical protein VFS43_00995 [Polyangiaceae bacterium]|nr:hypothetical protein [Polyangiaceae bacterium]